MAFLAKVFPSSLGVKEYEKKNNMRRKRTFIVLIVKPNPAEVNNRNTRTKCEICTKLTVILVSLFLTLNIFHTLR